MPQPLVLSPGQRVGPYTVVSPLRAGGMATLYLAQRVGPAGFQRPVALKVVHAHLGQDPQFVRMFLDEALLCARIRHPNVVHVEELGEYEGAYFLAMEYVDGASLEDVFDRLCALGERLPPRLAVSIACSLLEGLYATHTLTGDQGEPLHVVHRDVSPSNVLLDRAGHVKLIDFGVAKARGRAVETSAGTLKGKYAYMSPEQAFGRPIDHRSDLYSLGVVLWEMLAMRPLFTADTDLALLELARAAKIPSLCSLAPDLPPALDRAVACALAADPAARPQTGRELRQMLLDAFPDARNVDPAELGGLVERLLGPARRAEAPVSPSTLVFGSTVSSTPSGRAPEQDEARLATPAGTRAGPSPRRSRLTLIAAAALVAAAAVSWLVWGRDEGAARAPMPPPAPVAVPAPDVTREPAVPSLSEPPRIPEDVPPRVAPAPSTTSTAPTTVAAPTEAAPRRRRSAKEPTTRDASRTAPAPAPASPTAPASTRDVHGVPIVENPAF